MKRKRKTLGEPVPGNPLNDYGMLARRAAEEMRQASKKGDLTGAREAVNKAYLASTFAAREIVDCAGLTFRKPKSGKSSQMVSRAIGLLNHQAMRDPRTDAVAGAFSTTLGQHTTCYYDGGCVMSSMKDAVTKTRAALRHVPYVCAMVKRGSAQK